MRGVPQLLVERDFCNRASSALKCWLFEYSCVQYVSEEHKHTSSMWKARARLPAHTVPPVVANSRGDHFFQEESSMRICLFQVRCGEFGAGPDYCAVQVNDSLRYLLRRMPGLLEEWRLQEPSLEYVMCVFCGALWISADAEIKDHLVTVKCADGTAYDLIQDNGWVLLDDSDFGFEERQEAPLYYAGGYRHRTQADMLVFRYTGYFFLEACLLTERPIKMTTTVYLPSEHTKRLWGLS